MRWKVVLLPLAVLAGCGGGDDDTGDKPAPPAHKVNHEPRVEGKWRVVYTPLSSDEQESRATWTTTPECERGPCDFTIKSTAGAKHHFNYDPAIKDWSGRDRTIDPCGDVATNEVAVERGYRNLSQITLTPIRAVRTETGTFVSEMFGDRRDRLTLTAAGEEAGCAAAPIREYSLRAVRIKPPAGKEQTVGPKIEEGLPSD
jgi:hypothetical protein